MPQGRGALNWACYSCRAVKGPRGHRGGAGGLFGALVLVGILASGDALARPEAGDAPTAAAGHGAANWPRATAAGPLAAARAAEEVRPADPCRAWVTRDLTTGIRHRGDREVLCASAREGAQRRLLRDQRRWPFFGLMERQVDTVAGASRVLSVASYCWRWPLREAGQPSPGVREAAAEGCKIRRYEGPVPVVLVDAEGGRVTALVVRADREGRVSIRFAEVDAALRLAGRAPLLEWSRLEIGEGGWGGEVDLQVLRVAAADGHAAAVRAGRGVPALFVEIHGDHPEADAIRLLAAEAEAQRQGADYEAVVDGRLSPRRFLERHAISRFRQAVEALERGPAGPPTTAEPAEDAVHESTP